MVLTWHDMVGQEFLVASDCPGLVSSYFWQTEQNFRRERLYLEGSLSSVLSIRCNPRSMIYSDGAPNTITPSAVFPPPEEASGSDEPVFCICRRPDDHELMIQCNYCDEWYHSKCVQVTAEDLKKLKEYICPACLNRTVTKEKQNIVESKRTSLAGQDGLYDGSKHSYKKAKPSFGPKMNMVRGNVTSPKVSSSKKKIQIQTKSHTAPAAPIYDPNTDSIRQTVRTGFMTVLWPFYQTLSESHSLVAGGNLETLEELCNKLEQALFDALKEDRPAQLGLHQPTKGAAALTMCGQRYKTKYRSLQFNLKDPKNEKLRQRLFKDLITPERLVEMSAEDIANDELHEMIKSVRARSLTDAVVSPTNPSELIRKTHKGEESLAGQDMGRLGENPAYESPSELPQLKEKKNSPSSDSRSASWQGKILFPGVAIFEASASQIGGRLKSFPDWEAALPRNFHLSGRISSAKALDYICQSQSSPTREVFILEIRSVSEEDRLKFMELWTHLRERDRWGVVDHDTKQLRDLYLFPLSGEDELPSVLRVYPSFFNDFCSRISGSPSFNALLAIVVQSKQTSVSADSQEQPSHSEDKTAKMSGNSDIYHEHDSLGIPYNSHAPFGRPEFAHGSADNSHTTSAAYHDQLEYYKNMIYPGLQ